MSAGIYDTVFIILTFPHTPEICRISDNKTHLLPKEWDDPAPEF